MRLAVLAVVAACGSTYNPIDDIPHREYPDTASAVRAILDERDAPRVYAVGEYHPTRPLRGHPPIARFATEILPLLPANHLVIEAWGDASCSNADEVESQIRVVTQREGPGIDVSEHLARKQMHGLPMTCIEHSSMLDGTGRVDFFRLLAMVSTKLEEATRRLLAVDRDVIVYGGALHNDLFPPWPLDELAYAHVLAREVSVLELDLVVPEVVQPIKSLWTEDWFPLVAEATDRTLVWERGEGSSVLILASNM
jgi:hypothetical protein